MSKRILFFLGAGASYPFLKYEDKNLSTKFITDCLKNETLLSEFRKYFLEIRKEEFSNNYYNFSILDIINLVKEIEEILENSYIYKNSNFEHIIHILDKIALYASSSSIDRIQNIDLALIDVYLDGNKRNKFKNSEINGVSLIPVFLREYIVWIIIKCINFEIKLKNYKKSLNIIAKFYKYIKNKFGSISLYSLNYDPAILQKPLFQIA